MMFSIGLLWAMLMNFAVAQEESCLEDEELQAIVLPLFSQQERLYALLWWDDSAPKVVNAYSFIIDGHDSVPVFTSIESAQAQTAGSGYEPDLIGIHPGLLAAILQNTEYAIINPGGDHPIQFKTCMISALATLPEI